MNCKKAEFFLLRLLDDRLIASDKALLEDHLGQCPSCRQRKIEYLLMLQTLKQEAFPEIKPYFWERMRPKLQKKTKLEPWRVWEWFGLRAIPVSLCVVAILTAILFIASPSPTEEIDVSQTGNFLLQNTSPLEEVQPFLTEEGGVNKHLMLLFSSLDEGGGVRRYFP